MRVRVRRARARRAAPCKQSHLESHEWRLIDAGGGGLCGCKHATHGAWIYHLSMQHACTSAKGPRTTSGAVRAIKSHKLMAFQATPLGPVWVHAHYPTTMRMSSVDAACVFECEGPTHSSERRRAIKLIARMAPQRRRWGLCGCTHAMEGPSTCRLSMHHACSSAEGPRTTSGPVQSNRTNGATATPLGPVWVYAHVEWVCYCLRYSLVPRQSSGRGERESAVAAAAADDTEQMHTSAPHATTMSAAARIFCSMPPEPPPERESERVWSWPKGQVWGASHVLLRLQAPAPPPVG
jgi:hypothetical protein